MRSPTAILCSTIRKHPDKLQPSGNKFISFAFPYSVVNHKQKRGSNTIINRVNHYCPRLQKCTFLQQNIISERIHQRVPWVNKSRCLHIVRWTNLLLFKTDSTVFSGNCSSRLSYNAIVFPDTLGNIRDFKSSHFPVTNLTADIFKRSFEKGTNKTRLQFSGFGFIHFFFYRIQHFRCHCLFNKGIAANNLFQTFSIQNSFHLLSHQCFGFLRLTVTNSIQQQLFQRSVFKSIP